MEILAFNSQEVTEHITKGRLLLTADHGEYGLTESPSDINLLLFDIGKSKNKFAVYSKLEEDAADEIKKRKVRLLFTDEVFDKNFVNADSIKSELKKEFKVYSGKHQGVTLDVESQIHSQIIQFASKVINNQNNPITKDKSKELADKLTQGNQGSSVLSEIVYEESKGYGTKDHLFHILTKASDEIGRINYLSSTKKNNFGDYETVESLEILSSSVDKITNSIKEIERAGKMNKLFKMIHGLSNGSSRTDKTDKTDVGIGRSLESRMKVYKYLKQNLKKVNKDLGLDEVSALNDKELAALYIASSRVVQVFNSTVGMHDATLDQMNLKQLGRTVSITPPTAGTPASAMIDDDGLEDAEVSIDQEGEEENGIRELLKGKTIVQPLTIDAFGEDDARSSAGDGIGNTYAPTRIARGVLVDDEGLESVASLHDTRDALDSADQDPGIASGKREAFKDRGGIQHGEEGADDPRFSEAGAYDGDKGDGKGALESPRDLCNESNGNHTIPNQKEEVSSPRSLSGNESVPSIDGEQGRMGTISPFDDTVVDEAGASASNEAIVNTDAKGEVEELSAFMPKVDRAAGPTITQKHRAATEIAQDLSVKLGASSPLKTTQGPHPDISFSKRIDDGVEPKENRRDGVLNKARKVAHGVRDAVGALVVGKSGVNRDKARSEVPDPGVSPTSTEALPASVREGGKGDSSTGAQHI